MTKAYQNFFEKIDSSGLRDGRPCDTYRVNTQLNNVIHLAESAQCYRVNYVAANDFGGFQVVRPSGTPSGTAIISNALVFEFPVLLLRENQYPCFDVRIGIKTTDNSLGDVVADIVIGSLDMPMPSSPYALPSLPGSLGLIAGATTLSGVSQVVIEDQIVTSTDSAVAITSRQHTITDFPTGESWTSALPMAKAILVTFQTVPDFAYYSIDLIQIREYTPA